MRALWHIPGRRLSRVLVGLVALAFTSPAPWALGQLDVLTLAPMLVIVVALAVAALPMGRWAAGSWTTAALAGACVNLVWFYSLVLDPQAAAPWLSLFLLVPYLTFTVAGCIGFFRETRPRRWLGVAIPPVLYLLQFLVTHLVLRVRGVY